MDAAALYTLVALDLTELLLAVAELGGAGLLDAAVLDMLVASHLVMPLLAAAVLGGPGILGVAVRYMWIVVDLAELLLAVTGLTGPCIWEAAALFALAGLYVTDTDYGEEVRPHSFSTAAASARPRAAAVGILRGR